MCTALSETDGRHLHKFLQIFGEAGQDLVRHETHRVAGVTHLIVAVSEQPQRELQLQRRTMKYLHGLMAGQWILSPQWLQDCVKANSLLPEDRYEVQSSPKARKKQAPRRARKEVRAHGSSRLFERYVVALIGDFPGPLSPTKKDLTELLVAGRGVLECGVDELLHERHHGTNRVVIFGWGGDRGGRVAGARVIEQRVGKEVPVVHYNWLVDCIDSYSLLSPKQYLHSLVVD